MTPLVKAGLIGGILTTIGGVAYAGTTYFNSSTEEISKLIEKEYTHILLKTSTGEDTDHWTKAWERYKNENKNKESDLFKLTGWKKDGTQDVKEELKKKCATLKTEKIYSKDDELYKNVTKYCGRWVTLADEAVKDGFEVIKNSDSSLDSSTWKNKFDSKPQLQQHFNKLGLTANDLNAQKVREKCKLIESKEKQATDYRETLPAYKAVCTNPKGSA